MENAWSAAVFGVRGSVPQTDADFLEYGGNTSCVLADCGSCLVLFDAGSGLSRLQDYPHLNRPVHIFLTHLHLDHIMGLVHCNLFHNPEARIHFYGQPMDGLSLKQRLDPFVAPPFWPLTLDDFRAQLSFHDIEPGQRVALPGDIVVRALQGRHPNGCLYYRLSFAGKTLVYMLDCEVNDSIFPILADFARDANLLVWDAHFTEDDLQPGWGHSTWKQGLALRQAANAEKILMCHYAPNYTDSFLREQERLCKLAGPASCFAKEGMEIII